MAGSVSTKTWTRTYTEWTYTAFTVGTSHGTSTSTDFASFPGYTWTVTGAAPEATTVEIADPYNITSTYLFIGVEPNCKNYVDYGTALRANPDVSGLGVILAFLISAYVVLLWAILAYFGGLIPSTLLKSADTTCFRANSRRVDTSWQRALQSAAIIFSDQQIITGIGILLAGFVNLDQSLSAYHWQIITYLAWMSSNVHLTTLTLLRDWLNQNQVLRRWRIFGMTMLLALLIVALVPTTTQAWVNALIDEPSSAFGAGFVQGKGFGIPALCFWGFKSESYSGAINPDSPFSFAILIISYIWKMGQLYDGSRAFLRKYLRSVPEWILERAAVRELNRESLWKFGSRFRFWIIVQIYVSFVAWCEFLDSFMASLWLLTLGLVWGTLQIFGPRSRAPDSVVSQESTWSFGQILPLLFLLQPAAAAFEHFYGARKDDYRRSRDIEYEMMDRSQRCNGKSNAGTISSFTSLAEPISPGSETRRKLSDVLRHMELRRPSEKAKMSEWEPQIEFLYTSRFFKSILWLYQVSILVVALETFVLSYRGGSSAWYLSLLGTSGACFMLYCVFVPLGSIWSKAFK